MSSRRDFLKTVGLTGAGLMMPWQKSENVLADTVSNPPASKKIGTNIEKFLDPLIIPPAMTPDKAAYPGYDYYEIQARECRQWLHKSFEDQGDSKKAVLWGYGQLNAPAGAPAAVHSPGFTIEARKGRPVRVKWVNNLAGPHPLLDSIDRTIHGAENTVNDPNDDLRIITHLHGAEVQSDSDGWVMDRIRQHDYRIFTYPNHQEGTALWYHDHSMGITRINTVAGLAGFYLLRDPKFEDEFLEDEVTKNPNFLNLPRNIKVDDNTTRIYEIPLAIQDRLIDGNGSISFPVAATASHPKWIPEYFGDEIMVNGKLWPYLEVEPRKYRFRVLNGSNARAYNLSLSAHIPVYLIGTDGGFMPVPVCIKEILLMPAERADLIIDFSDAAVGSKIILKNDANAPYPDGDPVEEGTTDTIMQFQVVPLKEKDTSSVPLVINGVKPFIPYSPAYPVRTLTLNEMMGSDMEPSMSMVNNRMFEDDLTEAECPVVGSREVWEFINLTGDAHPIHLHLVQFTLLNRQEFDPAYLDVYEKANQGAPTPVVPPIEQYLQGKPLKLPEAHELAWKDTMVMMPGEVTRILVDFTINFIPKDYERYVYHCHILDHEDNEMMRPLILRKNNKIPIPKNVKDLILTTGVMAGNNTILPYSAALRQNYPNPFNPSTEIAFSLAGFNNNVELKIFNINGQEIRTLFSGQCRAGDYKVNWNGKDNRGVSVASGMYICRLTADNFSQSIKMNLIR